MDKERRSEGSVGARMRGQNWGAWGDSPLSAASKSVPQVERRQRPRTEQPTPIEGMQDPVTGLPSRALLADRLDRALKRARRNRTRAALVFIDLEHFEHIEATHGRGVADELLVTLGRRLQQHLREVDTVARLGAGEFAVVIEGLQNSAAAHQVGKKLATAVTQTCKLLVENEGKPLEIVTQANVGIAIFPDHAPSMEELVNATELALTQARVAGGGVQVYEEGADRARATA